MIRESWLSEISPDAPCGPDLEYDREFQALEDASRGKPEQQYGSFLQPAEEPIWADVVERATAMLDRTRDLRVVHLLARGLIHTQGLPGLVGAVGLARDLLDRFWDPLYPLLVFDGEPDPMVRMNALAAFADPNGLGLIQDVRAADFLRNAAITLSVRDVECILDPAVGGTKSGAGRDQLRAAVDEAVLANPAALGEPTAIVTAIQSIRTTLLKHVEPSALPDFGPLVTLVKPIADFVEDRRAKVTVTPDAVAAAADSAAPSTAGPRAVGIGELRSREDALRALDRVCDFLGRNEPTNPAPLLIRRAQRIMTMPFIDIIRELAPDATKQVETITGARSES